MKIGFYDGNIKNTKKAQPLNIAEFVNYIKYEKFKHLSDRVASESDQSKRQKLKASILPYVTISGIFSERNEAGLLEHSGLLAIDIDGVEDLNETKQAIIEDPYTFIVFKSVSGNGLCVIIQTSKAPEKHISHFRWAEQYYYDQFNLIIDTSCKDVSRPRYVSADKDVFVNEKPKKAGTKVEPKPVKKQVNWVASEDQMSRIVGDIHNGQINIAESYQDYLTCALAIAHGYGEQGRSYFHAVAMVSDKYSEKQADKKYDNALKTNSGRVQIGSFFHLAKQAGVELKTREETSAFAIAKAAKRSKSDVRGAVQTAQASGIDPKLAEEVAKKVFERDDINLNDEETPLIEEIAAFIKMNASLKKNVITRLIEETKTKKEVDTFFINSIYIKAKSQLSQKVSKHDVESVIYSDQTPEYNPITEFIENNRHLPEKPELIDDLINTLTVKDPVSKKFVRRWLLGLPAVLNKETVRLVLTLIGGQETGKTEWFRRLLPEPLQAFFGESNLMNDKDDALAMAGNWVILDDEMGGKSKKDSQKFKELTSKDFFMIREPYGKNIVKLKRLAILCATTNDSQVIYDSTGNTRILPVELSEKYNFEAYNKIDKTHLLMEVFRAYERGETWELNTEEKQYLKGLTGEYEVINVEGEMLDRYFTVPENDLKAEYLTATDVKIYLEKLSGQRLLTTNKLGIMLRQKFERVAKNNKYKYKVQKVEQNHVGYIHESESSQLTINQSLTSDLPF